MLRSTLTFLRTPVRAAFAASLLAVTGATADVLTVALDGSGDYTSIQAAIDAAVTGDEVVLQPGIYNETFDYLGKGLVVRSAEGPLNTRIDRNGAGGTVVTANGTPEGTRLEGIGFYVANGVMLDCDNANLVGKPHNVVAVATWSEFKKINSFLGSPEMW